MARFLLEALAWGWKCREQACGIWNGDEKTPLLACRGCGAGRPPASSLPINGEDALIQYEDGSFRRASNERMGGGGGSGLGAETPTPEHHIMMVWPGTEHGVFTCPPRPYVAHLPPQPSMRQPPQPSSSAAGSSLPSSWRLATLGVPDLPPPWSAAPMPRRRSPPPAARSSPTRGCSRPPAGRMARCSAWRSPTPI